MSDEATKILFIKLLFFLNLAEFPDFWHEELRNIKQQDSVKI